MGHMQMKDGRRQLSLRLDPETVKAIDARRGKTSRDVWFQKMADYCLSKTLIETEPATKETKP